MVVPKPDDSPYGDTPCDGDATATIQLPHSANAMHVLGGRVAYEIRGQIWIASSPEVVPSEVPSPFESAARTVVSGDRLLVWTVNHELYRLADKDAWKRIPLDRSRIISLEAFDDGQAFAVTEKGRLYRSEDAGTTWKRVLADWTEIDQLWFERVGRGSGALSVSGEDRAGVRGWTVLARNLEQNTFYDTHVRKQLPDGVTDRNGVPLVKVRKLNEALRGARRGCGTATVASEVLGVLPCQDETGFYAMATEDGGSTVREIYRTLGRRQALALDVSEDEVLLVWDCAGVPECRAEQALVLLRAGESWKPQVLPILATDEITKTMPDRTGQGGFWMFGTAARDEGGVDLIAYHTEGRRAARYVLEPRLPDFPPLVGRSRLFGPHVTNDGQVQFLADGQSRNGTGLGLFTLSRAGELTSGRRVVQPNSPSVFLGLHQDRMVLWSPALDKIGLSTDGGATVSEYAPAGLRDQFHDYEVVCGSAGCDFRQLQDGRYIAWRWGSGPLEETLTGALSQRGP